LSKINAKKEYPELYNAAKLALVSMSKDKLLYELKKRNITSEQWDDFKNWYIYIGQWCELCWKTWYKWRIGLYEMMEYTDEIKNYVLQGVTAFEIEFIALRDWMLNLERDGILKIIKWLTDLKEIYRLTRPKDYRKILEINWNNNV